MHEAFTPITLLRYTRPLRGVMIDSQPWISAFDFARLIGHKHHQRLYDQMDPDQRQTLRFIYATGNQEDVPAISQSAAYRTLCRYHRPEHRSLRYWLDHEFFPTLRDAETLAPSQPRRVLMKWNGVRQSLLEWQGRLWVPLEELPHFESQTTRQKPSLLPSLWRM